MERLEHSLTLPPGSDIPPEVDSCTRNLSEAGLVNLCRRTISASGCARRRPHAAQVGADLVDVEGGGEPELGRRRRAVRRPGHGRLGGIDALYRAIEERNATLTAWARALLEAASHLHGLVASASK
jgi:hypothetical protein